MFVFLEAINGYFRIYIVTEIDFFFYSISSSVTITTAPPPPLSTITTNDDDDDDSNNNNNNTNTLQFCAIILQFAASVPPHSPIRAVSS